MMAAVSGDVEAGLEAVLQAHARDGLGVDAVPGAILGADQGGDLGGVVFIGGTPALWTGDAAAQTIGGVVRSARHRLSFALNRCKSAGTRYDAAGAKSLRKTVKMVQMCKGFNDGEERFVKAVKV